MADCRQLWERALRECRVLMPPFVVLEVLASEARRMSSRSSNRSSTSRSRIEAAEQMAKWAQAKRRSDSHATTTKDRTPRSEPRRASRGNGRVPRGRSARHARRGRQSLAPKLGASRCRAQRSPQGHAGQSSSPPSEASASQSPKTISLTMTSRNSAVTGSSCGILFVSKRRRARPHRPTHSVTSLSETVVSVRRGALGHHARDAINPVSSRAVIQNGASSLPHEVPYNFARSAPRVQSASANSEPPSSKACRERISAALRQRDSHLENRGNSICRR